MPASCSAAKGPSAPPRTGTKWSWPSTQRPSGPCPDFLWMENPERRALWGHATSLAACQGAYAARRPLQPQARVLFMRSAKTRDVETVPGRDQSRFSCQARRRPGATGIAGRGVSRLWHGDPGRVSLGKRHSSSPVAAAASSDSGAPERALDGKRTAKLPIGPPVLPLLILSAGREGRRRNGAGGKRPATAARGPESGRRDASRPRPRRAEPTKPASATVFCHRRPPPPPFPPAPPPPPLPPPLPPPYPKQTVAGGATTGRRWQ